MHLPVLWHRPFVLQTKRNRLAGHCPWHGHVAVFCWRFNREHFIQNTRRNIGPLTRGYVGNEKDVEARPSIDVINPSLYQIVRIYMYSKNCRSTVTHLIQSSSFPLLINAIERHRPIGVVTPLEDTRLSSTYSSCTGMLLYLSCFLTRCYSKKLNWLF